MIWVVFIPWFILLFLIIIRPTETRKDREIDAFCLKTRLECDYYFKKVAEEKAFERTLTPAEQLLMSEIEQREAWKFMPMGFPSREAYISWKLYRFRDNQDWKEELKS